jgi:hypothetical protein
MATTTAKTKLTEAPVAHDTISNTPALRKSVAITCGAMATVVLATLYQSWRARQMLDAFTGGELPLALRIVLALVLVCAGVTALGMTLYVLAAMPVLARARQRAIERLLSAQAVLWALMGVSIAGMFCVAILGKIFNFLSGLWPF